MESYLRFTLIEPSFFQSQKMFFLDVFPLKIRKKYFFQRFLKNSWNKGLIIVPRCFLFFWFSIKANQVYYTWITCTTALLVRIQLLFSHCVKYVGIQDFSNLLFPACGQNSILIFLYLDRIYDSVITRENMDTILSIYRKIRIRKSPHFAIFHAMSCLTFLVII